MDLKISNQLNLLKKEYTDVKFYLNFSNPLELLVASILSAQCTDQVVNATTVKLFKKYKTAKDYATVEINELERDIKSVNFYRKKAINIIKACQILEEKYQGKIPFSMNKLIELPGISRKTANVIQQNAFNLVEGIIIDVYCVRVGYRLNWTQSSNSAIIERDFMKFFPKDVWKILPLILKAHGKAVCKAPIPYCSKCFLVDLCPKKGVTTFN